MESLQRCVPVVDLAPPNEESPRDGGMCIGNPIHPLTGTKREVLDLGINVGQHPIRFTYDSTMRAPGLAKGTLDIGPKVNGGLWSSSIHKRLVVAPDNKTVMVWRGNGRIAVFIGDGAGNFTAKGDSQDRLVMDAGEYLLRDAATQSLERYDAVGKLMAVTWKNGEKITLAYSGSASANWPGAGYLMSVVDGFDRVTRFRYYSSGLVKDIETPDGQLTTLTYDDAGNLQMVRWPDASSKRYLYNDASFPWALTGVNDGGNVDYATFAYDSSGRAALTEHAGGVDRFSASYQTPPALDITVSYDSSKDLATRTHSWLAPVGTTVSSPSASGISIGATAMGTRTLLSSQAQPAGSGCAASTRSQDFDQNGNLAWQNDFNGYRTCFANDLSRNLRVAQIQGLPPSASCGPLLQANAILPAGARKASYSWHPDWSLETRVAQPRVITTNVYNGQTDPTTGTVAQCAPSGATLPDGKPIAVLCKRIEQATTDPNGSQGFTALADTNVAVRTWQWTYNDRGQVITATDPLNNTTNYSYYSFTTADYTAGDLQAITNAKNQTVAEYTKYNPLGNWLEMKDANQVLTTRALDEQQRLKSITKGNTKISYEYWPTGLLKSVTLPDSSSLTYTYDDAHRLTGITDKLGNSVTYTLDNAGNRRVEEFKDPSGQLARTLSRLPDALNRVQQIDGRP